jgi:hypothetical protein
MILKLSQAPQWLESSWASFRVNLWEVRESTMPSARTIPDRVLHLLAHGADLIARHRSSPKVDDCERHAQECRDLAAKMHDPEVHDQLLEMARIWDNMVGDRHEFSAERPHFPVEDGELERDGD